jgi:hypothetical protein
MPDATIDTELFGQLEHLVYLVEGALPAVLGVRRDELERDGIERHGVAPVVSATDADGVPRYRAVCLAVEIAAVAPRADQATSNRR